MPAPAMTLDEVETPFLTIDLEAVERNVTAMQRYCDEHDIALRPHVKTHKMPEIAALQLRAGAVGLTCQKLGEAELLVEHRCGNDILITFPLIGGKKGDRFAELASEVSVAVAADSPAVARFLSAALEAHGTSAAFLVECDTGYGRTGVQSPTDAADLAEMVETLPGLRFRGLMTHPTRPESGPWLREARRLIEQRGLGVECVSGGGTPSAHHTHEIEEITELRVGNYVYGDRRSLTAGTMALEDCALRIRSTVVSTPTRARAIVDAGTKALTSDPGLVVHGSTYGLIVEYPDAVMFALSEEHGHVDVSRCKQPPEIGESVTIIPNHACGAVNMHGEAVLHHNGRDVRITPIAGRGLIR